MRVLQGFVSAIMSSNQSISSLSSCGQIQSVIVICTEGAVAFRTFSLPRLVTCTQAIPTKHVEALCEYRVFAFHLARRASKRFLVFTQLFRHHLVQSLGEFNLLHAFYFASELCYLLLKTHLDQ